MSDVFVSESEGLDLLKSNECSLDLYYIDTVAELFSYGQPIKRVMGNKYVQLKADELITANLYFKIQEFTSFNNWILDKGKTIYSAIGGTWEILGRTLGYDDRTF